MRNRLHILLEIAASAALIGLFLWRASLGQAVDVARDADYYYLPLALPLYLLACLLGAFRWRMELSRMRQPPVLSLFWIYLAGMMVNRLFPMRLGDVMRVQVPARRFGLSRAGLTAVVFVTETLLDGLAFVFLTLTTLAFLGVPELPVTLVWLLSIVILIALLLAIAAARLELTEGWQDRGWFGRLPQLVRRHAAVGVPQFLEGLGVLRDPLLAAHCVATTFGSWLLQAGMFWVFGRTFGLDLSLAQAVIVTIVAALVVSVPLVPFNLGTYEVAVGGVLVIMGASNPQAVTYSLGSHLMSVVLAALAGVVAMWALGLGLRDVFYLGATEQPAPAPYRPGLRSGR